jgi:pyruvate,orthophosphate dikinase
MKVKLPEPVAVLFDEDIGLDFRDPEDYREMRELLGGKGANLVVLTHLIGELGDPNIAVPPGLIVTVPVCEAYHAFPEKQRKGCIEAVMGVALDKMQKIEEKTGRMFGDYKNPLLVSARSGAKYSMPGMMETVLNIGIDFGAGDDALYGLSEQIGERAAYDSMRRFYQMYGATVCGIPKEEFDGAMDELKRRRDAEYDIELEPDDLRELAERFKNIIESAGFGVPEVPQEQLANSVRAVFDSVYLERAINYKRKMGIPINIGTAVTIQSMVYGNAGNNSGTGVLFTRDPSNGDRVLTGDYLINAQGEDVVAGVRDTKHIPQLEGDMPDVYRGLCLVSKKVEEHYRDMQDMEFTVQEERANRRRKLYILQTRDGKRTGQAAVNIAMEMEGLSEEERLLKADPELMEHLLVPDFDPEDKEKAREEGRYIATGVNVSPGAACGEMILTPDDVVEYAKDEGSRRMVLVREETSQDDVKGFWDAKGILTMRGGRASHAALISRQRGKPCVVGLGGRVDEKKKTLIFEERKIKEGQYISLDGTTGEVFEGEIATIEPEIMRVILGELDKNESKLYLNFERLMGWADEKRKLGVRANADTPEDIAKAILYGAEGVGLARTEHMFSGERAQYIQEYFLARSKAARRRALNKLYELQRDDFIKIYQVAKGLPIIIRLLDPPSHEFLPDYEKLLVEEARLETEMKYEKDPEIKKRYREVKKLADSIQPLREGSPMLGNRGVRLGIDNPELYQMQTRAMADAACYVIKNYGIDTEPYIMIPLVSIFGELVELKPRIANAAKKAMKKNKVELNYHVGTMIETPRACATADDIARYADFFSFGTNDLTQMTYGISRDDFVKGIQMYIERGIMPSDPFAILDEEGVGYFVKLGVEKGREVNPELSIGICGEHGGEKNSIYFCHDIGLDYVSCGRNRVFGARLAAAQAQILNPR